MSVTKSNKGDGGPGSPGWGMTGPLTIFMFWPILIFVNIVVVGLACRECSKALNENGVAGMDHLPAVFGLAAIFLMFNAGMIVYFFIR